MAKKALHPITFKTQVFCDNIHILTVETVKEKLFVDIWAGNHPFYTNSKKILDTEKRIAKFEKKYQIKF